jgi:nucleoside-diphosphate-sugar epimerase
MRVTVIGANGFVGSAFVRRLQARPDVELAAVTRETYARFRGRASDVVIDAAGNSRKYFAEQDPAAEFEASVTHRLRTLLDYPAPLHLHLSSVDVYQHLASPATTREDAPVDVPGNSRYGAHKFLAEQLVRQYAPRWLIVRLAGMVGPGLRKNPVYDILQGKPLWIHPASQFQFLHTDDAPRIAWDLAQAGLSGEIFNGGGDGLIPLDEIARLAQRPLNLTQLPPDLPPRVVNVSVAKIKGFTRLPATRPTIEAFVATAGGAGP